ncbi:MAG TPA: diacylglycerol kinase [Thermodesulfovibrionia bacterium]|nr:diacylglycerol kinase [Thermodesulfovibrionia bacterium]
MKFLMPIREWVESANHAINGILYAAKSERHVRYHLYAALFILLFSFIIGVDRYEFLAIAITVIMVILAEMINTAIEAVVDLLTDQYNKYAKIAKDVAAGSVLITAVGAFVIGYVILFPYLKHAIKHGITKQNHSMENIALVSLIITFITVIIMKTYFGRGEPLRGGMPSGHSAVSFSIWIIVTTTTGSIMLSILVFILATLIASSRVTSGIHRPSEVIVGALLGSTITYSLVKLFT